MANLEQTVLETFGQLSPGKQQEVLEFLCLLQQSSQPSAATAKMTATTMAPKRISQFFFNKEKK